VKLTVRDSAEDDLDRIFAWIAKDHPRAAAGVVSRIRDRIGLLEANNLAHMGRPGLVPGTRELIEFPYIVVYTVDDDRREVSVVAIVHGAQDRGRE
jgi:toxin ParE1/3/4